MNKGILFSVLFACGLGPVLGQQPTFHDTLLDRLEGDWILRGVIDGKKVVHDFKAHWVLQHQYLRIEETSHELNAKGLPFYQSNVYIGWDEPTHDYVCAYLDIAGGMSTESFG